MDIYRPEIDMSTLLNTMVTNFENPGFAFDIGAVYDYGDQWTFSAALNDVGMIKWKGSLNSFTSNGDFGFGGLPLAFNEILGNSEDTTGILSEIVDSIRNSVQMEHGEESFTTTTTPKLYLGAKYNINHVIGVGFVSKSTFYKQNTKQEFGLSANFNLYHFLTAHLSYNLALKGNNSLGLGLGLRGGPLQFYFIADYVPYSFRNYSIQMEEGTEPVKIPGPANLKNLSFMMGLNLLFGANGFRDEPMIDAYSEF